MSGFSPVRGGLAALALALPLFAALKFADYPVKPAAACGATAGAGEVSVGAEPVDDVKAQESYFHTSLTPKGFLPVFLVIENHSAEDSFLFDKSVLTIGGTPSAESKKGEGIGIASAIAGSTVGVFVALKLISNASQVQENLLKKEIQSKTLSPGNSTHGFLFAPIPKKTAREKLNLRIPVTRLATDEQLVLDLSF